MLAVTSHSGTLCKITARLAPDDGVNELAPSLIVASRKARPDL